MEANDEKSEKGEKGKMSDMASGLYIILLACLFVGTVVIAFTNHTGGWLVVIGAVFGLIILVAVHLGTHSVFGSVGYHRAICVAVLLAFVVFFMSSWFMFLPNSNVFATKEGRERIVLYQGKGTFFTVPYIWRIHYLRDFTASTKVTLLLNGGGEVNWEARAELSLVADYDQSFSLLREFRGAVAWKSAVQRLFQQEVDRYVAEHIGPDQAVITKSFTFELAEEGFAKLGFSAGEVTVREISRFIYKGE